MGTDGKQYRGVDVRGIVSPSSCTRDGVASNPRDMKTTRRSTGQGWHRNMSLKGSELLRVPVEFHDYRTLPAAFEPTLTLFR